MRKIFGLTIISLAATLLSLLCAMATNGRVAAASCPGNADNYYIPNNASVKAYNKFSEIDDNPPTNSWTYPDHANPRWACSSSNFGIYYITGLYDNNKGYRWDAANSRYELYLNYFAPSSGSVNIGMQGQIHEPTGTVYATHVRICTSSSCSSTQTDIFSYGSGWSYSDGYGRYFLRTNGSYSPDDGDGFSYPVHTAIVTVNMDKYIEKYGASNLIDHGTYREGVIWIHRCFNGSGCGWSKLKFLIEGERPTITPRSTIKNKTRDGSETPYATTRTEETIDAHIGEVVRFRHYFTGFRDWTTDTRCTITFYNNGGTAATSASPNFGNACRNGSTSLRAASDGVIRFGSAGGDFDANGYIFRDFTIPSGATDGAKYCEQLGRKDLTSGHGYTDNTEVKGARVCAVVHLPSYIDSNSTASVTDETGTAKTETSNWDSTKTLNSGNIIWTNSANTTVSFSHSLQRRGVANNFTFSPSITISNTGGSISGGAGNRTPSVTLGANASITTTSYTVSLLPEEETTICETLEHASAYYSDTGLTSNKESSKICVKLKRRPLKCDVNTAYEFGIYSGKNYGQISVSKNAGSSWAGSSPDNPDSFSATSRTASVEAWTKPNDRVVFKNQMCEGAEMANQYNEANKNITYTIDASSSDYMTDISTSSWNNSSLQGRSNVGKGIFPNNAYSHEVKSPASSSYTITNNHLGTSFYQSLTWTDLWMSGGNTDGAHNASWSNTATATVYTPYNYTTSLYTNVNRVYGLAGTVAGDISLTYSINKRANPKVNGSSEYATRSKKTKYQLISFKVSKNIASSSVTLASEYYADVNGTTSFGSLCDSIISSAARAYDCQQVAAVNGGGNSDRTAGESSTSKGGYSVSISDTEEIGTKICVVGAIWPADSHNLPTTTLTNSSDQSAALTETGNQWHLSQPSCFNVAKKPNFQVRATGAYAEQKVNTYISKRDDKLYGSWADFDLSSGGLINGMASGASAWGATAEPSVRACYYSLMSFANSKCTESKEVGNLPVNTNLASDPGNIYNQILTRYTSTSTSATSGGTNESNAYELKLEGACEYDETTGRYVPRGVSGTPSFSCLSNGAYYTKISGTAKTENGTRTVVDFWGHQHTTYVELWTSTDGYHSSNTYIIQVNGTLYINQNFRYGNIANLENTTYEDITEIPQIIFIADDIKISPDVTHLDAWLVAKNNIDTCYPGGGAKVSISNCDSQLTVTGPVIAKTLSLNRTYGGTGGVMNNSQPAEIFQLSPATYLWGYAQTQRYSQAITTFQRELPTRY